jgi:hypothetical protein
MQKVNKLLMMFALILLVLPMVSAAPPVLSTVQPGSLEIVAPTYNYVTQGADKDIYWHVFNTTKLLTNTTTTCSYHLYSQQKKGEHIVTVNNVQTFTNGRDFEVEVKGANFSTLGEYCHIIECNTTGQTGGIERCFTVTVNGQDSSILDFTPQIIAIIGAIAVLIALAVALHKDHGILSAAFVGLGFYMLVPLLETANIAIKNTSLSGVTLIDPLTRILVWFDYAIIVYIIVYVFIKVVSGYGQKKQEDIEGMR